MLASALAQAQDERPSFEITPLIGYRSGVDFDADGGANPNIEASASFGLILGYAADDVTRYELLYTRQQSEIESTGGFDLDVEHLHIGRAPLLAFGNSDGDLAMLRYAKSGSGARLALLLHHDDEMREVAYDRDFQLSPLAEALDKAAEYGITVVSMRRDWARVFS